MGLDETNEMRKNRQKPESKMRMRRKGDSQLAALNVYARLAGAHVIRASTSESMVPDMLGALDGRRVCATRRALEHADRARETAVPHDPHQAWLARAGG